LQLLAPNEHKELRRELKRNENEIAGMEKDNQETFRKKRNSTNKEKI
jgi:arginine deiminase